MVQQLLPASLGGKKACGNCYRFGQPHSNERLCDFLTHQTLGTYWAQSLSESVAAVCTTQGVSSPQMKLSNMNGTHSTCIKTSEIFGYVILGTQTMTWSKPHAEFTYSVSFIKATIPTLHRECPLEIPASLLQAIFNAQQQMRDSSTHRRWKTAEE